VGSLRHQIQVGLQCLLGVACRLLHRDTGRGAARHIREEHPVAFGSRLNDRGIVASHRQPLLNATPDRRSMLRSVPGGMSFTGCATVARPGHHVAQILHRLPSQMPQCVRLRIEDLQRGQLVLDLLDEAAEVSDLLFRPLDVEPGRQHGVGRDFVDDDFGKFVQRQSRWLPYCLIQECCREHTGCLIAMFPLHHLRLVEDPGRVRPQFVRDRFLALVVGRECRTDSASITSGSSACHRSAAICGRSLPPARSRTR
jgi:hypothetical protein